MKLPLSIMVCGVLLVCLTLDAGESRMAREPGPGERVEKTDLNDAKITELLVGRWRHEDAIGNWVERRRTVFEKDGSYVMDRTVSNHGDIREDKVKGRWSLRDGILTLTPTEPKPEKDSLYGQFTAFTILKISPSVLEWQIDYGHSDTSPAVLRTLTITTHRREK